MEMLTVQQVAELLKVSPSLVYQLVNSGRLPCYRIGGGRGAIRIRTNDMHDFLSQCRVDSHDVLSPIPAPRKPENRLFKNLDANRLRAAWHQKGVDADQPGGRSVLPSE